MRHTKFVAGVVGVALSILVGRSACAQLDPPAGPIVKTGKTLTEVEPRIAVNSTNTPGDADSLFKVTQPGSYYLTGNVAGVVGKHGIEITSSGVTLDLNGFDLVGVPGMGAFDGVTVTAGEQANVAVINGSVRGWGDCGVDLQDSASTNSRVERVLSSGNSGVGIAIGASSAISNCSASFNASTGISVGSGSTVTNCTAYDNTGNGISTGFGSTITNSSAYFNAGSGIFAGTGNTVTSCTAYDNFADGIKAQFATVITACSAFGNTLDGIDAGFNSTVTNCTAANNQNGITTSNGTTIADCSAASNNMHGIVASTKCRISNNTCDDNGDNSDGAGIFVTGGGDTRIEDNNCTENDWGIRVVSTRNFIARNTCAGNTTNWDVAAGNIIFVVNAATAGAVTGDSGGASPGSTNPNANYTY